MHHKGQRDHAALERDGLVQGQQVVQEHGYDHRRVANVEKGEDTEEEGHGAVETDVGAEGCHFQVSSHRHPVDQQQGLEEQLLQMWVVEGSQQDEPGGGGVAATGQD